MTETLFNQDRNNIHIKLMDVLGETVKRFNFSTVDAENHMSVFPQSKYQSKILLNLASRKRTSIGIFTVTSDNYLIVTDSQYSYAYQHVLKNRIIFYSRNNLLHKISLLNYTMSYDEIDDLNKRLDQISIDRNKDISFLQIMKLYNLKFQRKILCPMTNILFPGGRVHNRDRNILGTALREFREEISPRIKLNIQDKHITYFNIFDIIAEKFYHNLIFFATTASTRKDIESLFLPTHEVKTLRFIPYNQLPEALQDYIKFSVT